MGKIQIVTGFHIERIFNHKEFSFLIYTKKEILL